MKVFPELGLLAVMSEALSEKEADALSASAPLPFVKRLRVLD